MIGCVEQLINRLRVHIVMRKDYNQDERLELLESIRLVLYKMDSLMNLFFCTATGISMHQNYSCSKYKQVFDR